MTIIFCFESLRVIHCTDSDNQKLKETQHYIHQKHRRETEKTALANRIIYTLIWYGFYYLRSGNGGDPVLTAPEPTRGIYM